ncbi:hypothetical protein HQ560_18645 [bacterium]|nr:hypothetical protein [bacterium]
MAVHKYYDYITAASDAGISPEDLAALRQKVEADYPSPMVREMHLHALCTAIGRGELTVAQALAPRTADMPPIAKLTLGG